MGSTNIGPPQGRVLINENSQLLSGNKFRVRPNNLNSRYEDCVSHGDKEDKPSVLNSKSTPPAGKDEGCFGQKSPGVPAIENFASNQISMAVNGKTNKIQHSDGISNDQNPYQGKNTQGTNYNLTDSKDLNTNPAKLNIESNMMLRNTFAKFENSENNKKGPGGNVMINQKSGQMLGSKNNMSDLLTTKGGSFNQSNSKSLNQNKIRNLKQQHALQSSSNSNVESPSKQNRTRDEISRYTYLSNSSNRYYEHLREMDERMERGERCVVKRPNKVDYDPNATYGKPSNMYVNDHLSLGSSDEQENKRTFRNLVKNKEISDQYSCDNCRKIYKMLIETNRDLVPMKCIKCGNILNPQTFAYYNRLYGPMTKKSKTSQISPSFRRRTEYDSNNYYNNNYQGKCLEETRNWDEWKKWNDVNTLKRKEDLAYDIISGKNNLDISKSHDSQLKSLVATSRSKILTKPKGKK